MRLLLTILISLLSIVGYSQQLDSIKHIEIISEVCDSMALLNKQDIDKINSTYRELYLSDSLNVINDSIINALTIKTNKLDSILRTQSIIIDNDKVIQDHLKTESEFVIDYYKKELKSANNKKIFWQSTTGIGFLSIILILIL